MMGLVFMLPLFAFKGGDHCKRRPKSEIKALLGDFYYDSSRQTEIVFDPNGQFIEYEVRLFTTTNYKFLFDVSQMDPDVEVKIFKKKGKSGRELVFDASTEVSENDMYTYIANNIGDRLVIQYKIPAFSDDGCILFVLGFRMSEPEEPEVNIFKRKQ